MAVSLVAVTAKPVGAAGASDCVDAVTWFDHSLSLPCPRLDPTAYRYVVPAVTSESV